MIRIDSEIESKGRQSIRFLNETLQYGANDPSLALYRIQEHVHRSLPPMVQKRYELENLQERMNGLVFDIEYGVDAVKAIRTSDGHVDNIVTHLEKACYTGKQINVLRQQQIQQQLFEKKEGTLLASFKN